jgi:(Z)-2-((N-methylformamido)methylene)-5-hydroxybutyrolactone dehydrogenase
MTAHSAAGVARAEASALHKYQIYIGGTWREPHSGAWLESFDPSTGAPWALVPRCDATDAAAAAEAAHTAFASGAWPGLKPTARGALLRRLGDLCVENAAALSAIEVRDCGKRTAESLPQLRYLAEYFYYFGGLADKIEGAVIPVDRAHMFNYTRWEPYGVVAAITPWNSPLMLAAWKLAPALAAGNTVVLKPSEHASASTLELMHLIERAGFPPGVVNVVTGLGQEVGEALVTHPRVARISFTGSEVAGKRIAELATRDLKRVSLELGGKSPQVVFDDAELDDAVHGVLSGIFVSCGQSCVAGSRLLLHNAIYDRFLDRLTAAAKKVRIGAPSDPMTQIGPIANRPQYERILEHIANAREDGATCVLGGGPSGRAGWFIEPTIFTDVRSNMRLAREEVFGPVLAVMRFGDDDEAVRIANDCAYGLAAGVWTSKIRRAFDMAERIAAGTVSVNTYRHVSALSPAGGYKQSGFGRENGVDAIKEFMQVKSVWIGLDKTPNPFPAA